MEDKKVVYVDNINKRTTFTDPRLAFARELAGKEKFRQKHDASTTAGQVVHGLDLSGSQAVGLPRPADAHPRRPTAPRSVVPNGCMQA